MTKVGCRASALEVYERLHLWEDAIECYQAVGRNAKVKWKVPTVAVQTCVLSFTFYHQSIQCTVVMHKGSFHAVSSIFPLKYFLYKSSILSFMKHIHTYILCVANTHPVLKHHSPASVGGVPHS